ncbi:Protein of unknown function PDDEXK-like [Dillenia turbinata]|uniref:Uncharacterized protein n=1 Tax=Dillenia turbinata TaxID=194707 RepID=A0AAN8ZHE4_9MAGN
MRRAKRVTEPFDDQAKARLVGSYFSSGSEHAADDVVSPSLSDLVHGFLEEEDDDSGTTNDSPDVNSDSELHSSAFDPTDAIHELLNPTASDAYCHVLRSHVTKALESTNSYLRSNKPLLLRHIMSSLRYSDQNAAVCKTKWENSRAGQVSSGNYEFIDVVFLTSSGHQFRYIVELDFPTEFEIARPTSSYLKILNSLPRVFVGRAEELKRLVRFLCDAAKRSLKSRDLHLPPWRKNRYMQNKWFGPYKRTTSQIPSTSNSSSVSSVLFPVECRLIGFGNAVSDVKASGRLFPHAATRTR